MEYELVSESQSRLWLLLAFSLPQKIEAKSGDPVWHSDTFLTFIPLCFQRGK
jgi:hypothetical protein